LSLSSLLWESYTFFALNILFLTVDITIISNCWHYMIRYWLFWIIWHLLSLISFLN
jgi:hypothetical protein